LHMSIPFIIFLNLLYLIGFGALLALNDIEADLVALIDCDAGLQASHMNEIVLAIVTSYESEALDAIEKLDCSSPGRSISRILSPKPYPAGRCSDG